MQFHTVRGDPIVCFNNFGERGGQDFGFGVNRAGKNPDWTFSRSGRNYKELKLYIVCDFE